MARASCAAYDWPYPRSRDPNCHVPSPIREILLVVSGLRYRIYPVSALPGSRASGYHLSLAIWS